MPFVVRGAADLFLIVYGNPAIRILMTSPSMYISWHGSNKKEKRTCCSCILSALSTSLREYSG